MSVSNELPPYRAAAKVSLSLVLRAIVRHRGVQAAVAIWILMYLVVLMLADGSLPFDRPAVAKLPFALQIAAPRNTALSLMVVLLQYFGPGMIRSVLTLRTGNAWVHALSYHAVAPHVIVDTPLVVKIFQIAP